MISNRKLYRLGVGVALLMTCFLVYLVYNDMNYAGIGDSVVVRRRLIGHSAPRAVSAYRMKTISSSDLPFQDVSSPSMTNAMTTDQQDDHVVKTDFIFNKPALADSNVLTVSNTSHYNRVIESYKSSDIDTVPPKTIITTNGGQNKIILARLESLTVNQNGINDINGGKKSSNMPKDKMQQKRVSKKKSKPKKYMIYLCESGNWCGGWGDRQRGLASLYHLSKLLDREFKIVMNTPCKLTNFYVPRKTNWIWKPDVVRPKRHVVLNAISKPHFKDLLTQGDFNEKYPHDAIFLKTNQDFITAVIKNPIYADIVNADKMLVSKKSRFRNAWTNLMQPVNAVLLKLQRLVGAEKLIQKGIISKPLKNITQIHPHSVSLPSSSSNSSKPPSNHSLLSSPPSPKPLICAHVRMGRNPTMPLDEKFDSFEPSDITKLLKFLKSKDTKNNAKFYVATDHEGIRKDFREFFGNRLITNDGKILHIDRQRSEAEACVGFGVAVLDQLVLSVCDVLVTSRSGFSIHASYISNSTQPVYVMEDSVIKLLKI